LARREKKETVHSAQKGLIEALLALGEATLDEFGKGIQIASVKKKKKKPPQGPRCKWVVGRQPRAYRQPGGGGVRGKRGNLNAEQPAVSRFSSRKKKSVPLKISPRKRGKLEQSLARRPRCRFREKVSPGDQKNGFSKKKRRVE